MPLRPNCFHRVQRCVSFHSRSILLPARVRWISTSISAVGADRDLSTGVTKSKKMFSELPKVHLLPDGSEAPPCDDWLGGLEDSIVAPRKRKRACAQS